MKSQRNGYTLIEMIIVIAIIGVLSTLAFLSLNILRSRIRDVKRLNDVAQIQKALEYYANDHNGQYPNSTEFNENQPLKSRDGQTIYLQKIPANELATGKCLQQQYIYRLGTNGQNYTLQYCLGFMMQDYQAGDCTALPGILCNQSNCNCNDANKTCCGWCQQGDICSGGRLIIKNYNDEQNNFYDLVLASNRTVSDWANANNYCANLLIGDFHSWHLPNVDELTEIYNNKLFIDDLKNEDYWTSEQTDADNAYTINLANNSLSNKNKNDTNINTICLRKAQ